VYHIIEAFSLNATLIFMFNNNNNYSAICLVRTYLFIYVILNFLC